MGKRRIDESPGKERTSKKKATTNEKFTGKHGASDVGQKKGNSNEKSMKKDLTVEKTRKDFFTSTINDEEDFPRGGASALTPAEVREARLQAEAEFADDIQKPRKGRKGQQISRGAGSTADTHDEESIFGSGLMGKLPKSAEILRYKSLCVGMKIWGAVAEVSGRDLTIRLPGGLRGFVRFEDVSDMFDGEPSKKRKPSKAKRKGKVSGEETDLEDSEVAHLDDENGSVKERDSYSLMELFSVGQLVQCTVKSLEVCKGKRVAKDNKRIGLSLRLSHLLEGLTIDSFHEGMPTVACVSSVEDHGYLLSFGVPGVSGFLLHQNCDSKSKMKRGQLVQGVVLSVDKKRGTVALKADQKMVAAATVQEHEGLTIELLPPGSLVNARVRSVLRNGLLLSFLTYFTGTVDLFHLDVALLGSNWDEKYSENQRLRARILHIDPVTKSVGLTLNSHLLLNSAPAWTVSLGDTFDNAIVRRVDPTLGLLLELPSKPTPAAGYVHISNVSDEHIEKLEKKFSEGKKVRARVIGFREMDGLAIASLKKSVLEQLLLSTADVKPGMLVHGTVIAVESFGAILQLGETLKGLCPLQHMSEYQRATPSSKFKVGVRLKFRVLSCDPQTNKITLTHKKTMVSSKLTPITNYEDPVEGLVTHGWITGIEKYGCFVRFYNDIQGLAHRGELGITPGTNATSVFQLGQCVKCRVLRSDSSSQRLSISFVTSKSHEEETEAANEVEVGSIVAGNVVEVRDNSCVLDVILPKGIMRGVLLYAQLSDNLGHIEQSKTLLKPGYKFERLLVLEKTDKKVMLSAKFSLLQASGTLPSNLSQLQRDTVYQGYVANITESGCFVRFLGRLTGLAVIPQVADSFVKDASQYFSVGQSVRAKVLEINEEKGRFYVSLKQSLCYSSDVSLLQGYFVEEEKLAVEQLQSSGSSNLDWAGDLTIGSYVNGEIQDVKDYGVIMNLFKHKDIVGFLTHYQCESAEVGKKLKARVLDVVKAEGIADLTVRKELCVTEESAAVKLKKKKRKSTEDSGVEVLSKVTAVVELVKDEYLVLSLPEHDNRIGFASTRDYNLRDVDPHKHFRPGQRLTATVGVLPDASTGWRLLLFLSTFSGEEEVFAQVKKLRKNFKCDVGLIVEGEIISVDTVSMMVAVGKSFKGYIHITEVWDYLQEGHPFAGFVVGQSVTAKVLAKVRNPRTKGDSGDYYLELSVRPSELAATGETVMRFSFETLNVGQLLTAHVQEIDDEKAWLVLGPHLRGRLFVLDSSTEPSELQQFKSRFQIGHVVRCWVSGKDSSKGSLDLSLREVNICKTPTEDEGETGVDVKQPQVELKEGTILGGRVSKIFPGTWVLSVQIGSNSFGKVHITHLCDKWVDHPGKQFQEGQFVRCVVLDASKSVDGKSQAFLSLRPSLGGSGCGIAACNNKNGDETAAIVDTFQDLCLGLRTQGYVTNVSKKGCFVTLSRFLDARILLSNLSDSYVADPSESFPPGKLVKGRITNIDPLSERVEISLKSSSSTKKKAANGKMQMEDFHVGDSVEGQIRRIEPFGIFLDIENSALVGMVHVSEVTDRYLKDIQQQFNVGQKVQAKVLKRVDQSKQRIEYQVAGISQKDVIVMVASQITEGVDSTSTRQRIDEEKKRISLGMKESYFTTENDADSGDELDSDTSPNGEMKDPEAINGASAETHSDDSKDGVPSEDENLGSRAEVKYNDQENDDLQVLVESSKKQKLLQISEAVLPLEVDLDVDGDNPDQEGVPSEEDTRVDEDGEESEKVKKRERKRLKKAREAEIRAAEEKRLQQNHAPETVDEFEQLVRTEPNSSFVWIKYMAFMLSMADVDKARAIADRALQTINFREEAEKMNVWVAYLNLENAYGNPKKEAVLQVFQKALQYCDPKKLYLALLGIYERTEQNDMADELFKTMIRKFKNSAKVWLRYIQNLLKRGAAHKALDQSLLSLPRRKHLKVITHVSILEFKIGSPERGRAIFEGIVRNYPKRTDLWSVYLDQEIRHGDTDVIRALFERAICLELPPKKMKFLFKKYLDYEKVQGDEKRIEYVKAKAMEYVETKLA